ncbi:hypothetical protein RB195_016778 [Necator americanus]|uniref:Uncharacterized protein n=1 Tax=Necator americanus TaxID=51031 RepID=A0ABR1C4D7_NECAM
MLRTRKEHGVYRVGTSNENASKNNGNSEIQCGWSGSLVENVNRLLKKKSKISETIFTHFNIVETKDFINDVLGFTSNKSDELVCPNRDEADELNQIYGASSSEQDLLKEFMELHKNAPASFKWYLRFHHVTGDHIDESEAANFEALFEAFKRAQNDDVFMRMKQQNAFPLDFPESLTCEEQQHIALQISKQMELKWEKNCNDQKQQQPKELKIKANTSNTIHSSAEEFEGSNKEQNCTSEKKTPIRIEPVAEPTTKKANPPGCSQTGTKKPKIPKALEDHNYAASPPDEEVNVPEETEKTKKSKNFVRTYATRPVRTYLKVRGEQARYYSGELDLELRKQLMKRRLFGGFAAYHLMLHGPPTPMERPT